ncbi:unnamed protein product [Ectocarpus sp. 12 AP-2014]
MLVCHKRGTTEHEAIGTSSLVLVVCFVRWPKLLLARFPKNGATSCVFEIFTPVMGRLDLVNLFRLRPSEAVMMNRGLHMSTRRHVVRRSPHLMAFYSNKTPWFS